MIKHPDQRLVGRLLEGDEKAFTAFFESYFPRLFYFACARLWNDEDFAEEAAQNAMSKAVQKLDTFRGEAALFTWLCTICRHEIGAILKREKKLGERVPLLGDDDQVNTALEAMGCASGTDPFLNYQQQQLASLVHLTKTHIPTIYSDILEWKYLNGDSVKEIAHKLGRKPKAAESLLTRARVAFKDAFLLNVDTSNADTLR